MFYGYTQYTNLEEVDEHLEVGYLGLQLGHQLALHP